MKIEAIKVDYNNSQHAQHLMQCLQAYAQDEMGGGEPLSAYTEQNLISQLRQQPNVFSVLAYVSGKVAGLINCVDGFSTFNAKPLVNIHDVVVLPEHRGMGLTKVMLDLVEEIAKEKGCCKLTLEVLAGNDIAKAAYKSVGFSGYQLDPAMGDALFWQKPLP